MDRAAFEREALRISADIEGSTSVDWLLGKIQELDAFLAEIDARGGFAKRRAITESLIEQAQDRIATLRRQQRAAPPVAAPPAVAPRAAVPQPPEEIPVRSRDELARWEEELAARASRLDDRAQAVAQRERATARPQRRRERPPKRQSDEEDARRAMLPPPRAAWREAPADARLADPAPAKTKPEGRAAQLRPASPPSAFPASPGRLRPTHPVDAGSQASRPFQPPAPPPLTGRGLAELRARGGLTVRALAKLLGVSHGTISKAEARPDKPVAEALSAAVRALGAT